MVNRDTKKNYVLDMIIKNLDDVSSSLDSLSKFTNGEVSSIKVELAKVIEDVKSLQSKKCPINAQSVVEIVNVERLKHDAKKPKEIRELVSWVLAVVSTSVALYLIFKG